MIQVKKLKKSYGAQTLFDEVSFTIMPGERVGLVGRNGQGKTTLFRLLSGEEEPDEGQIQRPAGYRVGYLTQYLQFSRSSVLKEVCQALPQEGDEGDNSYRAKAVLQGLGFSPAELDLAPHELSGGFQVRLNLAKLLVSEPNLILLDEPTNYLDIISLRWLARFLRAWPRELLLITHDHGFMDQVCTHTMGIHRSKLRKLEGAVNKYYSQIQQEEEIYEQTRQNQERQIQASQEFINRFRAKASKATVVQSRIKALERIQPLERLAELDRLDFRFNAHPFPGKWLLEAKNVAFAYPGADKPLIEEMALAVGKNDRLAVIGKNGQGKTTLLRLLINELTPLGGEILHSVNLRFGYFGQTNVERLNPENTVEEEILSARPDQSRTSVRDICGMMMFSGQHAEKKIKVLSGGERSRVLLGKILVSQANCLFLDEPTNHLDQESTDAFLRGLEEFPGAVVIVSHSEMILERIATRLIVFDRGRAFIFEGGYRDFLNRVGWQEEDDAAGESGDMPLKRKDLRRLKADLVVRRSRAVSPLKERMAEIEQRICELEEETAKANEKLLAAAEKQQGKEIAQLSRSIHQHQSEIEVLFQELETVDARLQEESTRFDDELRELTGGLPDIG